MHGESQPGANTSVRSTFNCHPDTLDNCMILYHRAKPTYLLIYGQMIHGWPRMQRYIGSGMTTRAYIAERRLVHVPVDYPTLMELQQHLRERIRDKFNYIASIPGGKGKEVLNAGLDFAEASRRFCSYVSVRAQVED